MGLKHLKEFNDQLDSISLNLLKPNAFNIFISIVSCDLAVFSRFFSQLDLDVFSVIHSQLDLIEVETWEINSHRKFNIKH